MSLTDDLQTVDGVGPEKAKQIESIVEDYQPDVSDAIEQAYDYHQAGRPGYAGKYIARAYETLCGDD